MNRLLEKNENFVWNLECQDAFDNLKNALSSSPVLRYPSRHENFILCTDASGSGLGVVLEQGGKVVSYASRTLNKAEKNYRTIEKECLAVVFGTKQFRHYLLGRQFKIITDHNPLKWLSAQKMEGKLCRWALILQEFDFSIEYRKGSQNGNADALSRIPMMDENVWLVSEWHDDIDIEYLKSCQHEDVVLREIIYSLSQGLETLSTTQLISFRYRQIWGLEQFNLSNDILHRQYRVNGFGDERNVIMVPEKLKEYFLYKNHDWPSAGHFGWQKTLDRLKNVGYWVGMAKDVTDYCRSCSQCTPAKQPMPTKAPLINTPIGTAWQRIAMDVLEVPMNEKGNRYFLVMQDYFTKWLEAMPMQDQRAETIVEALILLFCRFGVPKELHSDQGRNFESTLVSVLCKSFGIRKTRTSAYHPQGDGLVERSNRILLEMLRSYVEREDDWENIFHLCFMRTIPLFILQPGRHPSS